MIELLGYWFDPNDVSVVSKPKVSGNIDKLIFYFDIYMKNGEKLELQYSPPNWEKEYFRKLENNSNSSFWYLNVKDEWVFIEDSNQKINIEDLKIYQDVKQIILNFINKVKIAKLQNNK